MSVKEVTAVKCSTPNSKTEWLEAAVVETLTGLQMTDMYITAHSTFQPLKPVVPFM